MTEERGNDTEVCKCVLCPQDVRMMEVLGQILLIQKHNYEVRSYYWMSWLDNWTTNCKLMFLIY